MRILIAIDKFKGSLSAREAAEAIQRGLLQVLPRVCFELIPIADGGEGTAEILCEVAGGVWVDAPCSDPLGRPVSARYAWVEKQKAAIIAMSEASGLWRLIHEERNPLLASTRGTGELMLDAISRGAREILVAAGGSATNDAGLGMASALGWQFLDEFGMTVSPVPENFLSIKKILPPFKALQVPVRGLCDVINPLLGERGCSRVFAPQKGASPSDCEQLESALTHISGLYKTLTGTNPAELPGAGTAGGLGFGLIAFCGAELESGFKYLADTLHLQEAIGRSDLVITGEGRLDDQTLDGKGPGEIARMAKKQGKPVIAFAGSFDQKINHQLLFDACFPIATPDIPLEEAKKNAAVLLESAAKNASEIISKLYE